MKTSKEDIVARAFPLFLAKGYEGTSMADLVSASGLSKGAFYYYFPDKASLFEACIDRFFTAYLPVPVDRATQAEPADAVSAVVGAGGAGSGVAAFLETLAEAYARGLKEARSLCGDASAYLRFVLSLVPLRRGLLLGQLAEGEGRLVTLYLAEHPERGREQAALFAEQSLALLEGIGVLAAVHNDAEPAERFGHLLRNYMESER
ncbi:MAG: TetR/AcrR family transcriptional regulator [Spirochaetes bacterium]|nr:TetR/AcrR family transcriptional regulator [Spirochaetota bacterium]MBU0956806.1 TetR/AcrR family transcriptional regulator [Spirochaetota bacterium]